MFQTFEKNLHVCWVGEEIRLDQGRIQGALGAEFDGTYAARVLHYGPDGPRVTIFDGFEDSFVKFVGEAEGGTQE